MDGRTPVAGILLTNQRIKIHDTGQDARHKQSGSEIEIDGGCYSRLFYQDQLKKDCASVCT